MTGVQTCALPISAVEEVEPEAEHKQQVLVHPQGGRPQLVHKLGSKYTPRLLQPNSFPLILSFPYLQDPYFPQGNVDLQYAIECETIEDKSFKVVTNRKSYTFIADTAASREEWVKAVRKVMFRTQHEGENVKVRHLLS